jgi:hypothetical protein
MTIASHRLIAQPLVPRHATVRLDYDTARSVAGRRLGRAWRQARDLVELTLIVWCIPFVILAIGSPLALILRAILAIAHRL